MKRLDMTSALVLLLALGLFTGCGDDSSGSAGDGDGDGSAGMSGDGDGDGMMEVIDPTYANIQERVFVASCSSFSSCHDSSGPPAQGLDLETDAITALVGVESTVAAGRILVVAGDPDNSYLIEKIESMTPAVGVQMPPNQPLDQNKIDALKAWIADGASAN